MYLMFILQFNFIIFMFVLLGYSYSVLLRATGHVLRDARVILLGLFETTKNTEGY